MKDTIRIAHISDTHLNSSTEYDFSHHILPPLLTDLKKYHDNNRIDIIAFTGDLIDKGGLDFKSTDEGFIYFEKVLLNPVIENLKLSKNNIFFAIGNHDLNRYLDSELVESGAKTFLTDEEKVIKFIDEKSFENSEAINRVLPFKNFEKTYYQDLEIEKQITIFESAFKTTNDKTSIGIACINSSWRCYSENDKGNLLIGERQITRSLDFINQCDIKILLSHHYTDYLCDYERILIDDLVTENFDIVLLGHNHSPETWCKSILRGAVFNVISRGNWTSNIRSKDIDYLNGYSIIDYHINDNIITIYPRVYSKKRNEYVIDSIIAGDEGKITHRLSDKYSDACQLHSIVKFINENYLSSVNEHLLTYNTDTNAPDDINKIFVEPNLIYRTEKKENDIDEQNILIEEICYSDKNYIIFGPKESGKTILLDKILIRFLEL